MNGANIHVIPNDSRDWVVKEEGTDRELGHYPSREDGEAVGLALARREEAKWWSTTKMGKGIDARPVAVGSAACLGD